MKTEIAEHDVVRVTGDVEVEGHRVAKGSVGTVVSVYASGIAYAVEIPALGDDPVVTLAAEVLEAA